MSQAIKLTIPDSLAKISEENVKEFGYSNIQELALEAIRKLNYELKNRNAIAILNKYAHKQNINQLTKEERKKLAADLNEKDASKILREFNLN